MKEAELKDKTQKTRRCKRQVDCVVIPPPYYQDDYVTIYNANCLDIVGSLAPDVIITDPPYPDYYVDEYKYFDGILNFLTEFRCKQLIFWSARNEFPLSYSAIHIWDKRTGNNTTQYERIFERNGQKNYQMYRHYFINSTVAANYAHDVYTGHKSQKPQKLMKELIKKFSEPSDTILDPFMGSGSTLFAAKEMGRKAIGIELNKKWCEVAVDRLSQGILPL